MDILKLPFDQYQRYKIVQEAITILRDGIPSMKILDVGGYPGQALCFFPDDDVTIVDQEECDLTQYKRADALSLPFSDGSFDVVTSVDVLEHIPPDKRQLFMKELCRVAKGCVCIAAPFDDPQVHEAEVILSEFIKAKLDYEHHFLHEHLNYGLPKLNETTAYLKDTLGSVVTIPNGNLSRWLPMMMMEFFFDIDARYQTLKDLVNEYYNTHYYRVDNSEPCYRYLVVAGEKNKIGKWAHLLDTLSCRPEEERTVDVSVVSLIIALTNLDLFQKEIRSRDERIQEQDKQIRERDEQIRERDEQMRQRIRERDEQIRGRDEQIRLMVESRSWRVTAPLRKIKDLLRRPI